MASSGSNYVLGNPTYHPAYQTDVNLQRRKQIVLGSTSCHVSSSLAPHAPILEVLDVMSSAINDCEAEASKEKGGIDAGRVAVVVREWHTKLWNILADLVVAEEQRANDVFKTVDWYNDNLAQQKHYMEQSNAVRMALDRKYKQDMITMEDECARRILACEAENAKLREEIQRLCGGVPVTEENDHGTQDDNLFAEMLMDITDK